MKEAHKLTKSVLLTKSILLSCLFFAILFLNPLQLHSKWAKAEAGKIEICHKDKKTLTLPESAIQAHLWHGDILWACSTNPKKEDKKEDKSDREEDKKEEISEKQCQWVDETWRPKSQWHQDLIKWKKIDLYKQCTENKYDTNTPHPWCKNIQNTYEKKNQKNNQKNKKNQAKGLTKKYNNCTNYGTPYPQYIPEPGLENLEWQLKANGSIIINADTLFTESQTVTLSLSTETPPDQMRFSTDQTNWTNWEIYQTTKDYLIPDNTSWEKTIYVQYKTSDTISETENDKIMLLPKYSAEYTISETNEQTQTYEKWKTYLFNITIKNTWFLTWDPENTNHPTQLRYKIWDETGQERNTWTSILWSPDYWNIWTLTEKVVYWATTQIPILVRIPETLTINTATIQFDLDHWWVTKFSQSWVKPLNHQIQLQNTEPYTRPTLTHQESLPFWIWEYTSPANEATPETVTICQPSENLYELSADQTVFTINYSVPFGRSITPHIYMTSG